MLGATRHRWSEEENEIVRRDYARVPKAELAASLGVSVSALESKVRKMRVSRRPRYHRWTPAEVAKVRQAYANTTRKELAASLGVKEDALEGLLAREGIRKCPPVHRWTAEEREFLRREYGKRRVSISQLVAKLGVSESAVKNQVNYLGFTRGVWAVWTAEEDRLLVALVGRYRAQTIAGKMGRSVRAVSMRANHLGLSFRDRYGWYSQKEAASILGVSEHWLKARIDNGTLKAQWAGPGRSRNSPRRISRRALRTFVRRYAGELVGRDYDLLELVDVLAGLEVWV